MGYGNNRDFGEANRRASLRREAPNWKVQGSSTFTEPRVVPLYKPEVARGCGGCIVAEACKARVAKRFEALRNIVEISEVQGRTMSISNEDISPGVDALLADYQEAEADQRATEQSCQHEGDGRIDVYVDGKITGFVCGANGLEYPA